MFNRYFNTNNLWVNLDSLKETLASSGGVLALPLIKNTKTVNPRDSSSASVYQLETAMGSGGWLPWLGGLGACLGWLVGWVGDVVWVVGGWVY